jgi:hypothetical protein
MHTPAPRSSPRFSPFLKAAVAAPIALALACGHSELEIDEPTALDAPSESEYAEELAESEFALGESNVDHAIAYALKLVGKPYGWWYSGSLPAGAPMWTANGPPPGPSQVSSANCAGLTNLMLRSVGRKVPHDPSGWVGAGGTAAYWAFYKSVSEPFNVNKTYPKGTLLGRRYRNNVDQGHVAVVLGNGRVLQSFANCYGCSAPGINTSYTVAQSHSGGYYEYAVLPQHWLGSGNVQCAYGDGDYCGGNGVTGDAGTLYRCTSGTKTVKATCANGCVKMSAGTNDHCATSSPTAGTFVIDSNNARNVTGHTRIEVSSSWISSSATPGYVGTGYYYSTVKQVSDPAVFWFYLPSSQTRTIDAHWVSGSNRSSAATFIMRNAANAEVGRATVNQKQNGSKWNTLGTFPFTKGWNRVQLSRWGTDGQVVIADAVRVR